MTVSMWNLMNFYFDDGVEILAAHTFLLISENLKNETVNVFKDQFNQHLAFISQSCLHFVPLTANQNSP